MFPLKDENPTELTPVVTYILIALNVAVWLLVQQAGAGEGFLQSLCTFGAIPADITGSLQAGQVLELAPRAVCQVGGLGWMTILTSMFMHGGWMHLLGNMWFLWVFGNNIEDSMGHIRYIIFYLLCGVAASLAHIVTDPGSMVPTVGASGAISGVMGAYLVLYPKVRVQTLFFFVIIIRIFMLPAWVLLIYWFTIQLLSGVGSLGAAEGGGVAFWAHIGGFVVGVALIKLFQRPQLVDAKRAHVKLSPDETYRLRW
jgi:membrane associated rhomboid family serine protease